MWKPGLAWLSFGYGTGSGGQRRVRLSVASVGMLFVSGWVGENRQRQGLAFGRAEAPSARRFIGTPEGMPFRGGHFIGTTKRMLKKSDYGQEKAPGLKRVRKKWGAAKEDVPQRLKPQDKTGLMARLKPCP